MDLVFFLIVFFVIFLAFTSTRQTPNAFANFVIGLALIGVGADLFLNGLVIPNTGISTVGGISTFLSTTHTIANPWVLGIQLMSSIMGFVIFGITIGQLATGRVMNDGSIR